MYHSSTRSVQFRPWLWYLHCATCEFILIYPVYSIMMSELGMSPAQVATLLAIWSASALFFEIPSGVLGDLLPRKLVLVGSCAFDAIAFLIWLLFPGFAGFAAGFLVWSFAGSLSSGTSEAYLYEVLPDKSSFPKIYGRTEAADGLGAAAALAVGGYAATAGYDVVLVLSIVAPIAGGVMLLWLPDVRTNDDASPETLAAAGKRFVDTLTAGLRTAAGDARVRGLILVAATLGALAGTFEEYVGLMLREIGLALGGIGLIYAGIWLARSAGTLLAHRVSDRSDAALLGFLALALVLALVMRLEGAAALLAVALFAFFAASGVLDVVYGARLQHAVGDSARATITSCLGMAREGVAVGLFVALGVLAGSAGWYRALELAAWAGVCLSIGWLSLALGRRVVRS